MRLSCYLEHPLERIGIRLCMIVPIRIMEEIVIFIFIIIIILAYALVYFISFILICSFIMLNLFVLVIIEQFGKYMGDADNPIEIFKEYL